MYFNFFWQKCVKLSQNGHYISVNITECFQFFLDIFIFCQNLTIKGAENLIEVYILISLAKCVKLSQNNHYISVDFTDVFSIFAGTSIF